ncbi:763feecf-684d-45ed-b453-ca1c07042ab7 [Thermothielavioides terrestris]|nr:763feecf-684d-45ed-b453-ca1c07042ab7 [Thermothielavioides terrestris]
MSAGDLDHTLKPMELSPAAPMDNSIPEFEVVMVAEGAWNLARCNPGLSGNCPRTAIVHLECLEQKSKQEGTWSSLERYLERLDWDPSDLASVVPLTSRTRDKMLAITQSFLHKALEIHRGGVNGYPKSGYSSPGDFNFIVLPSTKILEYFLRSYVRSLSVYYPLVTAGCVDPNEMLQNNQASTLLVLLMIAQGAAAMPIAEARYLSAGLTETCRISLFDIVEKDVELSSDPIALRCALLFIVLGAWSGDKWLMDIAMGQRGMYMSMLKHAGMLDPQPSMMPTIHDSTGAELEWRAWVQRETRNRLVYNYVMLDQELSLFHDTAPLFAITDLRCPLPGPEILWMSPSSERWLSAMQSIYGSAANVNPQLLNTPSASPSLYDLFQDFLNDNLSMEQPGVSPQQMRLILHPLQGLLCHLRQMLACFSDTPSTRRTGARLVTKNSTLHRLEEVQQLLQKWYDLSANYTKANPDCPVARCNLVLYHLISLNAVSNFVEIERFARREGFEHWYWDIPKLNKRCIFNREDAIFHCGQVFRLLRLMPKDRRPAWWSVAMYRPTLILWADSVSRVYSGAQASKGGEAAPPSTAPVIIDQVTPEDPAINAFVWNGNGVPMLTRTNGTTVTLDKPADILSYAIQNIEAGFSSRLSDGIKRKLITLGNNWSVDAMETSQAGSGAG